MSYLGFEKFAYRSGRPLTEQQRHELENRIEILDKLVPHDQSYNCIKLMSGQPCTIGNMYNDLGRVVFYNYLVVSADAQHHIKEKQKK